MENKWNDKEVLTHVRQKILDKLEVAGKFVESKAVLNIMDQGLGHDLSDGMWHIVNEQDLYVIIGNNVLWGRIHELGGKIVPKKAKALAIPIHPDAKRRVLAEGETIRDVFPDLIMIIREGHPPLLVRNAGKRNQRMDIMYVLVQSVTIQASPYLRPALLENKGTIMKIMEL